MDLTHLETRSLPAGPLPLVRACMDQLAFREVIDAYLPKHPLAHASDAECVMAMVLNILSGRVALWRMDLWLEKVDVGLLLGEGVDPRWFHDTRLSQCLDRLDAVGTDTLLGEVVTRYLRRGGAPSEYCVHLDTTSVSVHGAYETDLVPTPAFGFSKDKRPDLKQLVYGLSVHGAVGIPLTMSVSNGNTSDQASNRDHLAKLVKVLPEADEITVVADCKLVDAQTLGQLARSGFHFISLVPDSYKLRAELIEKAWAELPDADSWPLIAERPGDRKDEPTQKYRGRSAAARIPMLLGEGDEAGLSLEEMRFLVVHSDQLRARFERSLGDRLAREVEQLEEREKRQADKEYSCEADARQAAERLCRPLRLHRAVIDVTAVERAEKRPAPGRPKKGSECPKRTVWVPTFHLVPDDGIIEQQRRHASCFVLITDWTAEEWDDDRVLAEYRHQALIEGHTGFRWLKGPAAVAPVFLDTPTRIRALGLVMILALMVRNYLQFTLRARMRDRGEGIMHPFRRKRDDRLTAEMALEWFNGIQIVYVKLPGTDWTRTAPKLCDEALEILALLDIPTSIFARPPPR